MLRQSRFLPLKLTIRIVFVAVSILSYIVLCLIFYSTHETSAAALVILPAAIYSWYFGLRVGLLAGLIGFVLHILILKLVLTRPLEVAIRDGVPSYLATILISIVLSHFHDLSEQLKQELNRRIHAESALQESEIRFRTLVEQSPFSTQIFRPDGSVITVNPAFCALWNASPTEAQYVIEHYNILKDEQLEATGLLSFIQRGFKDEFVEIPEIQYDPQKTEMVKQTGLNTKWVLGYIWPVKDEQGHVQQVVLMHQDITERKQVEAQQLELALTRERTDLLKDLLNTFSHDLKTPLSIIDINLYLLEKISDPADQKSKMDTIKSQIHRLNKMIENMLMASYLDTAPVSAVQPLNLNTVLDQIRQDFSAVAEDRSIRLEFMAESTLPLVPVNEVEMRRVLVNLVENALHYTPFDGQITLRAFKRDNLIVVEVSDTGIGIEEVDLPHIFEHFYRTDKARATHTGGTGLGLSIAKKIVERNRGRLEVQSTFGQGSTFRVWLPLSQETISE